MEPQAPKSAPPMLGWSAKGCGAAAAVAEGAGADGGGASAPAGFRMDPASGGLELRGNKAYI